MLRRIHRHLHRSNEPFCSTKLSNLPKDLPPSCQFENLEISQDPNHQLLNQHCQHQIRGIHRTYCTSKNHCCHSKKRPALGRSVYQASTTQSYMQDHKIWTSAQATQLLIGLCLSYMFYWLFDIFKHVRKLETWTLAVRYCL